jgi:flavin reductase (DIM6/NTAB) family NADH-FMN oxidoreductase RutF
MVKAVVKKDFSYKVDGAIMTSEGSAAFRSNLAAFSTGVAIVTTICPEGENVGLTINSFSSLSLDPPMVLWCIGKRSQSVPLFQKGRPFTINVLTQKQQNLAQIFSSQNNDRFKDVALTGDPTGAPIIEGCLSWFECNVDNVFEGGDHYIVTGLVTSFGRRDEKPLVFHEGQYK